MQKLSSLVVALTEKISCDVTTSSSDKALNYAEVLKLPAAPVVMSKREKAKLKEIAYIKPDNVSVDKLLHTQYVEVSDRNFELSEGLLYKRE